MKMDGAFRDLLRVKIADQEAALSLTGYQALVADSATPLSESAHLIVYGVICSGVAAGTNRLPFFSLVTFRQAANELRALATSAPSHGLPSQHRRRPRLSGSLKLRSHWRQLHERSQEETAGAQFMSCNLRRRCVDVTDYE